VYLGVSGRDAATFTKSGGIVYGNDAGTELKNTSLIGHAIYDEKNGNWRNAGVGLTMNPNSYGFWLNDSDEVFFPSGFIGRRKRSNINNTLTFTENTLQSSSQDYFWILQGFFGNAYVLKTSRSNYMSVPLTMSLTGGNLVISGDRGNGEDNWDGTWNRLNFGDVVFFPSGFQGTWKRSNYNNTLSLTENTIKSSSNNNLWILQSVSGNAYTFKRADAANTITITMNLTGGNIVISGDSGTGENNWNGTWRKQ
jgi:hypothetical protein